MWERFSFYGMRALLVLYLTKAIGLDRPDALNIYAIYTGLIYLTPLIGGRLADRYLGQRKAVFIGGILMALGQFALTQRELLYLGLGLLIVGNGFFKPNISTMVGTLYPQGDARRDGAYTIFYMGINLGAFLSPLVCGPLGEKIGWGYGFAAAGVGMILGLLTFVFTQRLLQGSGLPPGRQSTPDARLAARDWVEIAVDCAGHRGARFRRPPVVGLSRADLVSRLADEFRRGVRLQGCRLVGILVLFIYATEPPKSASQDAALHEPFTAVDWQRIAVIMIISLFSIVFWMGFEQSGGTLNLFADEKTESNDLRLQHRRPRSSRRSTRSSSSLWLRCSRPSGPTWRGGSFPLPSVTKQGPGSEPARARLRRHVLRGSRSQARGACHRSG